MSDSRKMKHTSKVLFCVAVLLVVTAFADAKVFRTLCTRAHTHTRTHTHTDILFHHLLKEYFGCGMAEVPCGLDHFARTTYSCSVLEKPDS